MKSIHFNRNLCIGILARVKEFPVQISLVFKLANAMRSPTETCFYWKWLVCMSCISYISMLLTNFLLNPWIFGKISLMWPDLSSPLVLLKAKNQSETKKAHNTFLICTQLYPAQFVSVRFRNVLLRAHLSLVQQQTAWLFIRTRAHPITLTHLSSVLFKSVLV